MAFTKSQIDLLDGDLDQRHVKQRQQGWGNVDYIESHHAIHEANRIFGFDSWSSETTQFNCVADKPATWRKKEKGNWVTVEGYKVSYIAKVRVTVRDSEGHTIIREGTGAGHGKDQDLGLAHESAIKEAESDAQKRALRHFGNKFGLALYGKDRSNVRAGADDDEAAPEPAKPSTSERARAVANTPEPEHDPDTGEVSPPIDTIPDGIDVPFEITKEGSEAIRLQLYSNLQGIRKDPKNRQLMEEFAERRKILWERMNEADQKAITEEADLVREALKAKPMPQPKPSPRRKASSHKEAAA